MKFRGLICNKSWSFSEWFFPNVSLCNWLWGRVFSETSCLHSQGSEKKHFGPESCEGRLSDRHWWIIPRSFHSLPVLPHSHPEIVKELQSHRWSERGVSPDLQHPWGVLSLTTTYFSGGNPWSHLVPSYILGIQDNLIHVPTHISKHHMKGDERQTWKLLLISKCRKFDYAGQELGDSVYFFTIYYQ